MDSDTSKQRANLYELALNEVQSCMSMITGNLEGEELNQAKNSLKTIYLSYKKLQLDWTIDNNAFNKVESELRRNPDKIDFDIPSMIVKYQENDRDTVNSTIREFEKDFLASIRSQGETRDIISHSSKIDPISKKVMTAPVRNVFCNHTYDLESITALVNSTNAPGVKCPYQGCKNNRPILLSELIPDEILLRELKKTSQIL